jgi:MoxR-like ATPase
MLVYVAKKALIDYDDECEGLPARCVTYSGRPRCFQMANSSSVEDRALTGSGDLREGGTIVSYHVRMDLSMEKVNMQFEGTDRYYLTPELREIVNIAIAMEKPLLLAGEAGTGKTQLAYEISRALGLNMEEARCKSTFRGEELCYVYDTVLRLNDSRFGSGDTGREVNNIWDYLRFGPIGRAFLSEDRRVLLLDEIDKTDSDTQDNLLDVLEDGSFMIREINHKVTARLRPVIVITSNAKRELSDPFLRRCFCHYIPFPPPEEMSLIVRLHFPEIQEHFLEACLTTFYKLREQGFEKPPATAELLDWIGAMKAGGIRAPGAGKDIPHIGTILKRTEDLLKFKGIRKAARF